MTTDQMPSPKKTIPFGWVLFIFGTAILIPIVMYVASMIALRDLCGDRREYIVASWQRGIQYEITVRYEAGEPPMKTVVPWLFDFTRNRGGVDHSDCWDLTNDQVSVGSISLQDLLDGSATSEQAEAQANNLDLPRWEIFGPMAFLIYDYQGQSRADLPISFAFPNELKGIITVCYENGVASYEFEIDSEQLNAQLASHNLPPLPDSFLSRLPK